jgi:GGDEF domain-containing protein
MRIRSNSSPKGRTPASPFSEIARLESHYFPFAGSSDANKITVSIGVSSYPDAKITSDQDLVESADKALYAAKKGGRDRVCVFLKGEPKPALEVVSSHQ